MATLIERSNGVITVEIPEDLLRKANLSVGDPVEWTITPAGGLSLHTPGLGAEPGYEEWKTEEIQAALAETRSSESIPNDKVIEWLRSWGSSHELPPPL